MPIDVPDKLNIKKEVMKNATQIKTLIGKYVNKCIRFHFLITTSFCNSWHTL